jgi:hypothetical protein
MSDSDSSNHYLIDLEIAESLSRETLMSIDSSNRNEDIVTFTCVGLLLICATGVGFYGPPLHQMNSTVYPFRPNASSVTFFSPPLSARNRFILAEIRCMRPWPPGPINFSMEAKKFRGHRAVELILDIRIIRDVTFPIGSAESTPLRLWVDRLLTYDRLSLRLRGAIGGLRMTWICGETDQVLIQMLFRLLYALAVLVALFLFTWRLRQTAFKIWHLEQQLTVFLLVFAFLDTDPLCFFDEFKVTRIGVAWDTFVAASFRTYLLFFGLTLFDSLRFKNRKIGSCFFAPKIVFFALFWLAEIVRDSEVCNIPYIVWFPRWVYVGWALFVTVNTARFIDVTERYKFAVYAGVSVGAILVVAGVCFLCAKSEELGNTSLPFVVPFSVQNFFVLLMTLFHWPFELLTDRQYQGTEDGANTVFFANADARELST